MEQNNKNTSHKEMTLNEYQNESSKTRDKANTPKIAYPAFGLCGEAGEVADKLKKILRDKHGKILREDRLEIIKELGDVLWYVAQLALDLGYSLEDVARINIEKLRDRQKRGVIGGSGDNR